jgi:hypothetical protein
MKNLLKTIYGAMAVAVVFGACTLADAGVVYDVDFQSGGDEWFNGWSDNAVVNEVGVSGFSSFIGGEGGYVDLLGDQSGVSIYWAATPDSEWYFDAIINMTFDADTEVHIFWSDGWGSGQDGYFETDPEIGTYLVNEGETFTSSTNFWSLDFDTGGYLNITFSEVPAPGALSLLGLAGIITRRRR